MITEYPIGTTIFNPAKCFNGYTLFCFPSEQGVKLTDMNGDIVNKWDVQAIRAKLLNNGNILVVERRKTEKNPVLELNWDGHVVWDYEPPGPAHHDVERLDNGNTLVLCKESIPKEYKDKIDDPVRRRTFPIRSDLVLEVSPDKEISWEWHAHEHLDINRWGEDAPGDWTHINTVQTLPENRHYDNGKNQFKPGNVMLSPRNLGFIFIIDKKTKEIVWEYSGDYAGGLAGQHEPHMIEKGLPGEGNIIIFDNGALPMKRWAHTGKSFVLEIDPATERLVWIYRNGEKFYSAYRSNVQRLPNGNTLICESEGPRIFEVTQEGEIVWEYAIEWHQVVGRAYRYSYDYCPQLATLGTPLEKKVNPSSHTKIFGKAISMQNTGKNS